MKRFEHLAAPHEKPGWWDGPEYGWEDSPRMMRRFLDYLDSDMSSWGVCPGCGRRLPLPLGNEVLPVHRRPNASPQNPQPWCDTVPEAPEWAGRGPAFPLE